jgi:ATP-binding cassette, subfamily C (CFTR/MRP), member 1
MGCYDRIQVYLLLEQAQRSSKSSPKDKQEILSGSKNQAAPSNANEKSDSSTLLFQIKNGSFSYGSTGRAVVQNLSVDIPPGSITIVLGPVGSGKSTLLKAMLGEVAVKDGSVQSYISSIGYCPHDPWLPNLPLRDIITGFSEYDEKWFATVLHTCALDEDVLRLSKGVHTKVGTKGAVLSGGQKQRLVSNSLDDLICLYQINWAI